MEENLLRISETWNAYNSEFEESGEIFMFFFPPLWLYFIEWFKLARSMLSLQVTHATLVSP